RSIWPASEVLLLQPPNHEKTIEDGDSSVKSNQEGVAKRRRCEGKSKGFFPCIARPSTMKIHQSFSAERNGKLWEWYWYNDVTSLVILCRTLSTEIVVVLSARAIKTPLKVMIWGS
ncbi:unnamed protein product, partial [Ectocarpus sp. 13 AM-2016]